MTHRSKIFLLGFAVILAWVNAQIYFNEKKIAQGTTIILELAPVDPRSLMQGDYMILRYKLADEISAGKDAGLIYLNPDSKGLARSFSDSPKADSVALRYRVHNYSAIFGIESFLFQEGMAETYQRAQYSEIRVTPDGVPYLIRLLDKNLRPIGENTH